MSDEPKGEKKLHIDENWKEQVEAERSAAGAEKPQPDAGAEDATAGVAWPEPSLPLLVTTLATQAMSALGFVAHPVTGKAEIDLPQAKHFIDTLDMLRHKTEGNQTPDEAEMFEKILHELRMTFVAIRDKLADGQ